MIRGGPSETFLPPSPSGEIEVELGVPILDSEDRRVLALRAERGSTVLDLGGRNADAVWQLMLQHAQVISDAVVSYDLFVQIGILLTQRMMDSRQAPRIFTDFWTQAYAAIGD